MKKGSAEKSDTILLLCPDGPNRRLLQQPLEQEGFDIVCAGNAGEARAILSSRRIDVMLCDPRISGETPASLIGFVNGAHPDTAILLLGAPEEAAALSDAHAVDERLPKPVQGRQLVARIARALKRRREGHGARTAIPPIRRRPPEAGDSQIAALKQELSALENALDVLLKKHREAESVFEADLASALKKTVFPHLERLLHSGLKETQHQELQIAISNLKEIVSPRLRALAPIYAHLTPMEVEVALLVKAGRTTKEIAKTLRISGNTVMSHRFKIRTKLGLKRKKQSLRTFLNTLEPESYMRI